MQDHVNKTFFSPSMDLIVLDQKLPYDLYVNSSLIESKEKFIRIFPKGQNLSKNDLKDFVHKYHQLYISENQRKNYFKSITSSAGVTDEKKVEVLKDSAIGYLDKIFDPSKEFSTAVLNETIEGCRDAVESMIDIVHDHDIASLQDLIGKLSFHDFYTYDHSVNVSMYCISIYRSYNPSGNREEETLIGLAGLLHDLGKIKIPTEIINNPGKLSDEHFNMIKKHPDYGKELLSQKNLDVSHDINMNTVIRIANEHHEDFNGNGYPNKLKGDEIHILARITAIADFFDAITTKRSYSESLSIPDAIALMKKTVGKKLDPVLFEIFEKQLAQKSFIASNTVKYVHIDENFDPSQPHEKIPLVKESVEPKKVNFGFFPKRDKK